MAAFVTGGLILLALAAWIFWAVGATTINPSKTALAAPPTAYLKVWLLAPRGSLWCRRIWLPMRCSPVGSAKP